MERDRETGMPVTHQMSPSERALLRLTADNPHQQAPSSIMLAPGHTVVTIAIGKDHHATLIIDDEAMTELVNMGAGA